jgi:hypothetical protein
MYSLIWHFINNDDYLGSKGQKSDNEVDQEPKINVYKYKTEYD